MGAVLATAQQPVALAAGTVEGDFNGDGYADLVLGVAGEDLGDKIDAGTVTIVYGDATGINPNNSQGISQAGPVAGVAEAGDQFGRAYGVGDINNDGRSDLVVGAPNEAVGSTQAAGGITVLFGSSGGLATSGTQSFTQSGPVAGVAETGDRFGAAVALGDFDGDGRDDVAVGVPGEDEGNQVDAGTVNVIYGSSSGLTTSGNAAFGQAGPVAGASESDDRFGTSLAVADFNGDGYEDLAVGVPGEDIGSGWNRIVDAGSVAVLYGSSSGLRSSGSKTFSQSGAIVGSPEAGDAFGTAVTGGDFDGDGYDDLAVGVPGEAIGSIVQAGQVNIIYGSSSGLTTSGNRSFSQAGSVEGAVEAGDRMGSAVAAGDFDNDGRDDLAIGAPGEDLGSTPNGGSVNVLYGTSNGLSASGDWAFSQAGSIAGAAEAHDLVGSSLAVVDLDGDGYDDVVAGAPGEDHGSTKDTGTANIVYGSSSGLRSAGNEGIGQAGPVAGAAEAGDSLGLPDYGSWLDRVNLYRMQAGLDPVAESAALSDGSALHSQYMVINDELTHAENPNKPGYTAAGNQAGSSGNVYVSSSTAFTDNDAVDGWITGPFHAVGMLTPSLTDVGFGAYRDPDAGQWTMGATLDIWSAPRNWNNEADGAYTWPGDGSVIPVRRHTNEYPSPTTHPGCGGHSGVPVLVFFENNANPSNVTFTRNGSNVDHCVFDGTDYVNSNGSQQGLGRQILAGANAVVIFPAEPLTSGANYCFSASSGSESASACFTVDPNAK